MDIPAVHPTHAPGPAAQGGLAHDRSAATVKPVDAGTEPSQTAHGAPRAHDADEAPRSSASIEEQAIRAAFQAQLTTGELLSVVRDPADLLLPDAPQAVL